MAALIQQLRNLVSEIRWDAAAELLRRHKLDDAADMIASLPFEQQRLLFRHLPIHLAAAIVGYLPYFHAYVLFHSLKISKIAAIIDAMEPTERGIFFEALPEETRQELIETLQRAHLETKPSVIAPPEGDDGELLPLPTAEEQPIIEARQIEKYYRQPEGRDIHVVAPIDPHHRVCHRIGRRLERQHPG